MDKQLGGFNIVVSASNFNPTVFNQVWLHSHKLINDDDLKLPGNIFTDAFAQINTQNFVIVITPQQLQFIPKNFDTAFDSVKEKLLPLIRLVPQTPFVGIDINFDWHITLDVSISEYTKNKFAISNNEFFKSFDTPNSAYGYYISRDIETIKGRLKLNIRPVQIQDMERKTYDRLQLAFNYHRDLNYQTETVEKLYEGINATLTAWMWLYNDSVKTTDLLLNS